MWNVKYSAVIPYSRQTWRRLDWLHRSRLYTRWCTLSPWRSKRACYLVKHWLRGRGWGGLICYCCITGSVISFYASIIRSPRVTQWRFKSVFWGVGGGQKQRSKPTHAYKKDKISPNAQENKNKNRQNVVSVLKQTTHADAQAASSDEIKVKAANHVFKLY